MSRIFCYEPQRHAIEALLPEMGLATIEHGRRRINGVGGRAELQGQCGTFVEVEGHPKCVPDEVRQTVKLNGFLTVVLSDKFMRDRRSRAL